jgi:hypothetical protein
MFVLSMNNIFAVVGFLLDARQLKEINTEQYPQNKKSQPR